MPKSFFDTRLNWSCVTRCGCRTTASNFFTESELHCILWAKLHPLSYAAPHWVALHCNATELHCTLLSYVQPADQPFPSPHHALYWGKLHLSELRYRHSAVLYPIELQCTMLRYCAPCGLTLTELRCTLLSCAVPYWRDAVPLLSYAASCELRYTLISLPTVLVPLCNFLKSRNAGLSGTGIRGHQSGAGMLQYRTEMLDAGIPMPAALAQMPKPSYANKAPLEQKIH